MWLFTEYVLFEGYFYFIKQLMQNPTKTKNRQEIKARKKLLQMAYQPLFRATVLI
jgi:hypothetical protein